MAENTRFGSTRRSVPDSELSPGAFAAALGLAVLLFLAQALYLVQILVPSQDEIGTLFLGSLAVSGRIGLYDDNVIGHRAPVPFYVFGATQVLFGRSLVAGRALAIAFGVALVVMTGLLARRLGGPLCGALAALFMACQGVIVAYYIFGDHWSLVPLIIVTGLFVMLSRDTATRRVAGTAILASLFFVRTHVMPIVPFAMLYGLWRSRSLAERCAVFFVTALPPLAFFLWDTKHLKLLANVAVVNRFVARLGYYPPLVLDARPQETLGSQAWWVVLIGRRYEFLLLATLVAGVLLVWRLLRSPRRAYYLGEPRLWFVAVLFVYLLGFQFILFRINFKWIGMYAVSFTPLLMILLGFVYGRLLLDRDLHVWFRRALAGFLVVALTLPIYFNRNPVLPIGAVRAADPFRGAHLAASELARLVPADAKVFFFGSSEVYYLSGLPATYFPQVYSFNQLAVVDDNNWATTRSGFYGMPQVEAWLSKDADYAVVSPEAVRTYGDLHPAPSRARMERMRRLLADHFQEIGRVDYYYYSYEVYRRKSPRS